MLRFPRFILTTTALIPVCLGPAVANPLGSQVVAGQADVGGQGTSSVTVTQATDRAVINWNSFNIGKGEATRFVQPSTDSISLNRVTGNGGPSFLDGMLSANGKVFLVNPDGILFGANSRVNVGGFLATTNDIKNDDFMAGRYQFNIPGKPDASITNLGAITAQNGGFAALVAPGVRNAGTISASLGTVGLTAANGFTLDFYGDKLITLGVDDSIASKVIDVATGRPLDALIKNEGKLKANGGRVELSAAAARQVVDAVINNSGVIEANTIGRKNGMIVLGAATVHDKPTGAPTQLVKVSGRLSAAGKRKGASGGKIQITGESIALTGATLDASGRTAGGTILVGGDTQGGVPTVPLQNNRAVLEATSIPTATSVSVDERSSLNVASLGTGSGGKAVIWSDEGTSFAGHASATGGPRGGNGGYVEVSSPQGLVVTGTADVSAPKGTPGLFFIDPMRAFVVGSPSDIPAGCAMPPCDSYILASSLAGGGSVSSPEEVNIQAPISATGDLHFLGLAGSINVDASVISTSNIFMQARTVTINQQVSAGGILTLQGEGGVSSITVNAGISAGTNASISANTVAVDGTINSPSLTLGQAPIIMGPSGIVGIGNPATSYNYLPDAPSIIQLNANISGTDLYWYQNATTVLRTGNPFVHFTNWTTSNDVKIDAGSAIPANISAHNIQVDVSSLGSTKLTADSSIRFTAPSLDLGLNDPNSARVRANGEIIFDSTIIASQPAMPAPSLPSLGIVASQITFTHDVQINGTIGFLTSQVNGSNIAISGNALFQGVVPAPTPSNPFVISPLTVDAGINVQPASVLTLISSNDLTINGNISSRSGGATTLSGANVFLNGTIDVSQSTGVLSLISTWFPGLSGSPTDFGIVAGANGRIVGGTGLIDFSSAKVGSPSNPIPASVIPDAGSNSGTFVACANVFQCSDTGTKISTSYSNDPAGFVSNVFLTISQGATFASETTDSKHIEAATNSATKNSANIFSIPYIQFSVVRFGEESGAVDQTNRDREIEEKGLQQSVGDLNATNVFIYSWAIVSAKFQMDGNRHIVALDYVLDKVSRGEPLTEKDQQILDGMRNK